MSKLRVHLFVREHSTGWVTASVLGHPELAAFAEHFSIARRELEHALRPHVAERRFVDAWHEALQHRVIAVDVVAEQHDRLVTVPMRFSLTWRPTGVEDTFEVRVPRLDLCFRIRGEDNVEPWAIARITGALQTRSVRAVLGYAFEASERVETLEVAPPRATRARAAAEVEPSSATRGRLAHVGIELVAEATDGHIARAELRDGLVDELAAILGGASRPAALLVGPSGAGKTALVHTLAHRIAAEQVPLRLRGAELWSISGARMVAGARFLGEWQAKADEVLDALRGERAVWFAGSLAELADAANTGREGSGLGLCEFLTGPISAGELVVVAESTPDALARVEARHPSFVRAFQRLTVPPMSVTDATAVLDRAARRLERAGVIEWAPGAVGQVLDVVTRHGDADGLPGSAIALLDRLAKLGAEATRDASLAPGDGGTSGSRSVSPPVSPPVVGRAGRVRVGPREVVRAYARMTGFPEALIDPAARLDVDAVRAFFRARVIGQPHVIDRLVQVIVLLKAGLDEPGRPLGSFLFMGPTGVGKTESALALTEYLFGDRRRLVRFDLGEYAAPGSALRLVDGPGGQGALTQAVREQPFSVVLLDEVEKADGGVHDLLLQVLGEGRLTDGTGRTVRFDHTLVVLTSNLGAVRRAAIGYGGGAARPAAAHYLDAAERFFRPELVNRIDHLVPFDVLSEDALAEIARLLLAQALEREGLTRRGVQVELDDAVVAHVVARGYDPRYGARPMKRAVEAEVIVPLARALAASGVGGDAAAAPSIGRVRLEVVDGAVAVRGVG